MLTGGMLVLVAAISLGLASAVSAAEPTGYGELTRFGELEAGKFEGHLAPERLRSRAIGVDPTDNSVYLLEEPKERTATSRDVRLEKFVANGSGEYSIKASVEFKETAPQVEGTEPTIEGLAVDASEKRVYLLANDVREETLKRASRTPGGEGVLVASTLYAFSTVESGETLVPATGTKTGGIVIGPSELGAQSETLGEALLQPRGIAVDPEKHEVIILAHEDKSSEQIDRPTGANDHYVLQRITAKGELGARYVDQTDFFKKETETPFRFTVPDSPIVVSAGGKEHVYVNWTGLVEVPYAFGSSTPPKVIAGPVEGGVAQGIGGFPQGGGLAASEGTVFGANVAGIRNEEPGGEGRAGAIAYSGETGKEIGWTGGGQLHATEPRAECTISPDSFSLLPSIAAGSGGKLFVLAPEFLLREKEVPNEEEEAEAEEEEEEEEPVETEPIFEPLPGPFFPPVIEFGPGGTGCPQASATTPVATVNGVEVKGEETIKPNSPVVFSSQVKQADALEVEWNFGDGSTETVEKDEFQTTSGKHIYTKEGAFTVTETIHGDDLASSGQTVYKEGKLTTPTITVTRTLLVGKQPPKAQFVSTTATVGEATQFTSHATDPNGSEGLPLTDEWSFGDGSTAGGATASHTYAAAGTYAVKLAVTDKFGLKSEITQQVVVLAHSSPPAPPSPPPPPANTTTTTPATTTTSAPPGKTGVLSYTVSLAGSSALSVSKAGSFALRVHCGGQSSCTGSAVLRTASAVSARAGRGKRKVILTLASGSFALAGGQVKSLTLHLSSRARSLLRHLHVLRARVSIVARDASGTTHKTTLAVVLKAAKSHHH